MRSRLPLVALLAGLLVGMGFDCGSTTALLQSPTPGQVVTTPAVAIAVRLPAGRYDAATLALQLNGASVALAGGPTDFTASLAPGAPLQDDNQLVLTVASLDGVVRTERRAFSYAPAGKARLRRISDPADLITGPLAHGQLGDWLLENGSARFVIQDVAKRDLYSVGGFGGNLIDAELVGRPGLDNFLETQPAVNVETVINAQTVEIVNDGQDGLPAVLRTCGPDDILDFVNVSTILTERGFPIIPGVDDQDYDVEGCTEYALAPAATSLRMTTTLFNGESTPRGFYVGDYVSASGEVDQWAPPLGMGEALVAGLTGLHFEGIGEARGASYAHIPIPVPGVAQGDSFYLSTSGVTYVLQSMNIFAAVALQAPPVFIVPGDGSRSFERWFGVGDGSGGSGLDLEYAVRNIPTGAVNGCVTVGGAPVADVKLAIGATDGTKLTSLLDHFTTDATGCYSGTLAPGHYGLAAARAGSLYEGGLGSATVHPIDVAAGGVTTAPAIDLPPPARLRVQITDQDGAPVPARVSVIGVDPSPEPVFRAGSIVGELVTGTFGDVTKDGFPYGLFQHGYAGADGVAEIEVEPGSFVIVVSRGAEYSLWQAPATLVAGETTQLAAQIARVLDTAGFVSSDFHVHGIRSSDSRVNDRDRVLQYAGEGVDDVVMTDHHVHTDLNGKIAAMGMTPFLRATVGEEITTWDYGHFNAYPLKVDPTRPSRGSTDWAQAAPPGRDFPAYGAFGMTPAQLLALATTGPQSYPDTTIQVNHIDSFFAPLRIDTSLVPPQSFITPGEKAAYRLDPASGNLFAHFPALELWNGAGRRDQQQFLNERIGVWFNLLNQGLRTSFVSSTDTHEFFSLGGAGARCWTASSTDAPAGIDSSEVARAVTAGKASAGQGVYVQTRLRAADGSGRVADLTLAGSTDVASANGAVDLEIDVQSPLWAEWDRIEIYANAATTVAGTRGGTPVLFGATPSLVLDAGADFTPVIEDVFPSIPGAQRRRLTKTVSFPGLTQDTWFVVVVRGRDGVSRPLFPVSPHDIARTNLTTAQLMDGNLGENGTLALGATNALYADVDGVPGFQAPSAP